MDKKSSNENEQEAASMIIQPEPDGNSTPPEPVTEPNKSKITDTIEFMKHFMSLYASYKPEERPNSGGLAMTALYGYLVFAAFYSRIFDLYLDDSSWPIIKNYDGESYRFEGLFCTSFDFRLYFDKTYVYVICELSDVKEQYKGIGYPLNELPTFLGDLMEEVHKVLNFGDEIILRITTRLNREQNKFIGYVNINNELTENGMKFNSAIELTELKKNRKSDEPDNTMLNKIRDILPKNATVGSRLFGTILYVGIQTQNYSIGSLTKVSCQSWPVKGEYCGEIHKFMYLEKTFYTSLVGSERNLDPFFYLTLRNDELGLIQFVRIPKCLTPTYSDDEAIIDKCKIDVINEWLVKWSEHIMTCYYKSVSKSTSVDTEDMSVDEGKKCQHFLNLLT